MKLIRLTLLLLFSCLSCLSSQAYNLPDLGSAGVNGLSPAQEREMGKEFMLYVRARMSLVHDLLVTDYINNIGLKLASMSNRPSQPFQFFVVKDGSVNAFAGPGGFIGVNTGLILFTKTEGELSAVLAHEIAHVTQRHIAQAMDASKKRILPTAAAILASILVGSSDAAGALVSGGVAGNIQASISHTRYHEQEADRIGIETLHRAGFDPNDMANMFQRMQRESYNRDDSQFEFLRTHPLDTTRVAQAQNQSAHYHSKPHQSSLHYYLVQIRLATDLSNDPKKMLIYFEKSLKKQPNNVVYHYGYALMLAETNQLDAAIKQMRLLSEADPDEIYFPLTLADLQSAKHDYAAALHTLKTQMDYYPEYYPLYMQYAGTLIKAGKAKQAVRLLRPYLITKKTNINFLGLYAHALGKNNQLSQAYQIRAKIFLLVKQLGAAIGQLNMARKYAAGNKELINAIDKQIADINKLKR